MRTGDEIGTETLLAAMDAADAEAVILPASAVPDEERPLLSPWMIFIYTVLLSEQCSRWYSLKSVFTKAIIVGLRLL